MLEYVDYKGGYILSFGKYKGEKLSDVLNKDKGYYKWLCENSTVVQTVVEQYRKNRFNTVYLTKFKTMLPISDIYYVNVHSVGTEFRIKSKEAGMISFEDIMGTNFSIHTFEDGTLPITEKEHNMLYEMVKPLWIKGGKLSEDRGLY